MGNLCASAHCTVHNNTNRVVDIQTFALSDALCRQSECTYSLRPGESIEAKVPIRTAKGLKVGVIFNQWASGIGNSQPGCRLMIYQVQRGKTLTIEKVQRNYRDETPVTSFPKDLNETTFVLCYGQRTVEKHSTYWYMMAPYSWPMATIS